VQDENQNAAQLTQAKQQFAQARLFARRTAAASAASAACATQLTGALPLPRRS
jgi:hypothetical protein